MNKYPSSFLLEIVKSINIFKKRDSYIINADQLEVTNENIWKQL